jgi:uncharacterized membrane protein YbhN (UPF0104 family)
MVLAVGLGLLAARIASGHWPHFETLTGISRDQRFPAVRLAGAAAVICVVNAHATRRYGVIGSWLLLLGGLSASLAGATTVGGGLAAVLLGIAAGAAVRLALGTSAGRPSIEDVAAAVADLGIGASQLAPAARQTAGVLTIDGSDRDGQQLSIKVFGRDAYDNQLLAKLWRTLWYRDSGPALALSKAQGAEREALLTLLARKAGVRTADVLAVGLTAADDAVIVLRTDGRPLVALSADEVGDVALRNGWQAVERLGAARLAHRSISPWSVLLDAEAVSLVDLGPGTVAAERDEQLTDRAQLLGTFATAVGVERAVQSAAAALGKDELAALLPYLQEAAFGPALRRAAKTAAIDVDDLRKAAAGAADAPTPELAQLRRVTWGTVLQLGLLLLAAAAVFKFVGGVDFTELAKDLRTASWGWIIAGAIVAQLPRLTQAVSTLGSIPARLPFGPVYVLQLATSYMNLALPSSIARMAVNVRFFQRQGVAPATAITSGAIDSFANNVVQAVLLVLLLVFSSATLNLDIGAPSAGGVTRILVVLLAVLVVLVLALLLLPAGRRLTAALRIRVEKWWPEVKETFTSLRASHKLAQLFLGNVATELLFATSLGLFAHGLGYPLSIANLLVINMSVSLFSSFIPVPGGIGVVEGGLMVGLSAAGVPEEAAFATAILYRIATFYLPPVWGWFALQWLRRNHYL